MLLRIMITTFALGCGPEGNQKNVMPNSITSWGEEEGGSRPDRYERNENPADYNHQSLLVNVGVIIVSERFL